MLFLLVVSSLLVTAFDHDNHLLVESYGKLFLIKVTGESNVLLDRFNSASLSPDGRFMVYTTLQDQKSKTPSKLHFRSLTVGNDSEVASLVPGSYFKEIVWEPHGRSIAYSAALENKGERLFLLALPFNTGKPRDMGPWYQGISFSPDGSKIVHAVNREPKKSELEVLDIASGERMIVHSEKNILWEAKYAPVGDSIAFTMTNRDPGPGNDDSPDCGGPSLGLRLYSGTAHRSRPVAFVGAPKNWDNVKNFTWSSDGRYLALTLGTTDCDYPGSENGVFLISADQNIHKQISKGKLSFEPVFSPDNKTVAFVDFESGVAKLMRFDIQSGKLSLIREADSRNNFYHILDWK